MIDARGYSCPEPVIMIKKAMESGDTEYDMMVDNPTSKENVSRYARHQGYEVDVTAQGEGYTLHIYRK
ncbi:MAG: sulfurtransferase TusA family protein [Megasphaera sp.]|jgi:TusA-related sulfurtransferase|nr:sulfurtransferase TusA family protein [Megasphaera sp.]MCI1248037.1 sulfurtransferase TusA family protein [Megasphaera sp.]